MKAKLSIRDEAERQREVLQEANQGLLFIFGLPRLICGASKDPFINTSQIPSLQHFVRLITPVYVLLMLFAHARSCVRVCICVCVCAPKPTC